MLIELDGLAVKLIRKRIKNLNLRIHRSGDVHVSVPMRFPLELVYRFLEDKREWIDGHQRKLQARPYEKITTLETGDMLLFRGQRYELHVHEASTKNYIVIENAMIHFLVKQGISFEEKQILLNRWYRDQMQQHLPELFNKWESLIGVHANAYGVKLMKTRWGSCNILKKRIWLNLKLIQKAPICLEYVLVHELVHLLEASHNKRFYALMTQFMPDWKRIKILLDGGGSE